VAQPQARDYADTYIVMTHGVPLADGATILCTLGSSVFIRFPLWARQSPKRQQRHTYATVVLLGIIVALAARSLG